MVNNFQVLKKLLNKKAKLYNQASFIKNDPITIPHQFTKLQDVEIMAFWTAMLAWGQRVTIINKSNELVALMDNAPHDFIIDYKPNDLKRFLNFKHRTFNTTDTLYFLTFLQDYYRKNNSLETAFSNYISKKDGNIENGLVAFHNNFFALPNAPERTKKHIATPLRKSTCKRLCMFLRWMVRKDNAGVDFGLWKNIKPSQLLCPLDVHVERVARHFGLITRKQRDWKTVLELTDNLKQFDKKDPVRYDFALFGMGIEGKY